MDGNAILTGSIFAALVIEGFKWLFIYAKKDPTFSFPAKFYVVAIPILSFASGPFLAWLNVSGYAFPTSWEDWGKQLVVVAIQSLAAIIEYQYAIKPLADHGKARMLESQVVDEVG